MGNAPPYNIWVEKGFTDIFANKIKEIDAVTSRPIFIHLCEDAKFHGVPHSFTDTSNEVYDVLTSSSVNNDNFWRLLFAHGGCHYSQRTSNSDRKGVFAVMEKFLFRQKALMMCSLNPTDVKALNGIAANRSLGVEVPLNRLPLDNLQKRPTGPHCD